MEKKELLKIFTLLTALEASFMLYAVYRGMPLAFLGIALITFICSLGACFIVFKKNADKYLVVVTTLLLNIGIIFQYILQNPENPGHVFMESVVKCMIVFVIGGAAAYLFKRFGDVISRDVMIYPMILLQLMLVLALALFGETTGDISNGGARINLKIAGLLSIQPLEMVKFIYIFVMAALLCKDERQNEKIMGLPRELFFIFYTLFWGIWMVIFSELGTFLVMFLTGLIMMHIYSPNRKAFRKISARTLAGSVAGVAVLLITKPKKGVLGKVYERINAFLDPQLYFNDIGFQGTQLRKAISIGGLLGPKTERYLTFQKGLPSRAADMAFANLIQYGGVILGCLLIIAMICLLYRSFIISANCSDRYFGGLAMAFGLLISVESLIAIGVNTGLFPVVGIPIYLLSEGFTATTSCIMMVAVLLVISTDNLERSVYNEDVFEEKMGKLNRTVFSRRKFF